MSQQPAVPTHGFDVTILIDICRAILMAKDAGERINENAVTQANIIPEKRVTLSATNNSNKKIERLFKNKE